MKINFNFMTKITLMAVILIVLTATTIGVTTLPRVRGLLIENQLLELDADAEISSVRLISDIDTLRNDVLFLSRVPEVQGIRRAIEAGGVDPIDLTTDALWRTQLIGIFSELLLSKPAYVSMQYISAENGLELINVSRDDESVRVLGRRELGINIRDDYFLAAQSIADGEVHLSDVALQRDNGELIEPERIVLFASTPIYSDDGQVFGVIVVGMDFGKAFNSLLDLIERPETVYVTNQAGDFLLNSEDESQAFGFEYGESYQIQDRFEFLSPLLAADNTVIELPASANTQSDTSALHFMKVPFDPLNPDRYFGVAVATPYSEIVGDIDTFITQAISIVIVLTLTGMVLAFFIARLLIKPLYEITSATQQISEGQFDIKLNIDSDDEFGQLSTAFNQMTEAIRDREQELVQVNASLEQRVTERTVELREARDEALAAQRIANENSRLKSEFLSMMSHELRTPMNAIEGFTGIILKRMAGADFNQKTERYLHKIQSNSRRLLDLINDFLDLSRIESGRLELAYLPISPSDMVNKWHDNLVVLADNKGLEFNVSVDPNLPDTIYGDEESISKIAVNLVGNAVKFTERGSINLTLRKKDDLMEIEVRDTGIGIPPHAREFIFDEFRQVDQSSKRKFGGTGLGLAIVQRLAREMGGNVTLQSEVGIGSAFTVILPIHTENVEPFAEGVM